MKYEASHLFIERATDALPAFSPNKEQAQAVAQICQRLDGMPLAIELAAARITVLSVKQIAERLEDCFSLLTAGKRTALPRQQTLRATIDWSFDLLSAREQQVFARLSVFAGGFSLEAAESVCSGTGVESGEVLDLLAHLVDKSLVIAEERLGAKWYHLLETIRRYGQEKLHASGMALDAQRRHRDWYLALVQRADPELLGPQQELWYTRLDTELGNVRAALSWSFEQGEPEAAANIAVPLLRFWLLRGYLSEGRRWFDHALAGLAEPTALRGRALQAAAMLVSFQGDHQRAMELLEQSLTLYRAVGDESGIALSLHLLGRLEHEQRRYDQAALLYEESLFLMRRIGHPREPMVLAILGQTLLYQGNYQRARALCEESLALAREQGDTWSVAGALTDLGHVLLKLGECAQARAFCEESLGIRRRIRDRGGSAHTLAYLGWIALHEGDADQARRHFQESLALRLETGEKEGQAAALEGLAAVACVQGQPVTAVQLYGAAEAVRKQIGIPPPPPERAVMERDLALLRPQMEEAAFTTAWERGQSLPLEQTIALAVALTSAPSDGYPSLATQADHAETGGQPPPRNVARDQRKGSETPVVALRILALGAAQVEREGQTLAAADWTYAKAKELLFYLLAAGPRTKEQVGLALWPEMSSEQLRSSFHAVLHHLRRALGQPHWILFEKERYRFNGTLDYWYDLQAFEAHLQQARQLQANQPAEAIASLSAAITLYQGDYLDDLSESEWAAARREEVRRLFLDALLTLGQLHTTAGQHAQAADTYRQALTHEPYLETAHRELMRCYARLGERGQAIRHYQRLGETMRDELASRPAPETRALVDRIRRGEAI